MQNFFEGSILILQMPTQFIIYSSFNEHKSHNIRNSQIKKKDKGHLCPRHLSKNTRLLWIRFQNLPSLSCIQNIFIDSIPKVRTGQIMQNDNQRVFHFFLLLWEHFIPSKPFCVVLSVVNCCRIYFKKSKILTPAAK